MILDIEGAGLSDPQPILDAIEAVKRYIGFRVKELGLNVPYHPPKGPIPTRAEFFALIDALRRWAIRRNLPVDTSPLQDFRDMEASMQGVATSGLFIPVQPDKAKWLEIARRADVTLNGLKNWAEGRAARINDCRNARQCHLCAA